MLIELSSETTFVIMAVQDALLWDKAYDLIHFLSEYILITK